MSDFYSKLYLKYQKLKALSKQGNYFKIFDQIAKEQWFELLPEDKLKNSSENWGFFSAKYNSPLKPAPTIKYAFRRIRNALGHGNINIKFPPNTKRCLEDKADFEKKLIIVFHDVSSRNPEDTFDMEIILLNLLTAIREFHKIAYMHVTDNSVQI
jgi:hypothetical protein